jgi:DNA-binding winged helix-turn-helix (wHTH) protein
MTLMTERPSGPEKGAQVYRFAGFELSPALARLSYQGEVVALEPRAFDVLLHLIRQRSRLVTNQELLQCYWPQHVTRTALPHCIADLRRALGDSARRPTLIETTRGRGYRFVAAVQLRDHGAPVSTDSVRDRALAEALAAAERATASASHEEAASHLQACVELVEAQHPTDMESLSDVLLRLGQAQLVLGDEAPSRANFLRVAEWARSVARTRELGQAALGFTGSFFNYGVLDPAGRALVLDALEALGESGSARLRAALLARLSTIPPDCESPSRRTELADRSAELAYATGNARAVLGALRAQLMAGLSPDGLDQRGPRCQELLERARDAGDLMHEAVAYYHRAESHLARGDLPAARLASADQERAAQALCMGPAMWLFDHVRVSLDITEGRFAESAERLAAGVPGERRKQRVATSLAQRVQAAWLDFLQGGGVSAVATFGGAPMTASASFARRAWDAMLLTLQGPTLPAREALAALDDWQSLARDQHWLWNLQLVGTGLGLLREARGAEAIYAALEPYGDRLGLDELSLVHLGPVEGTLGLLASALGRFDQALEHCAKAREHTERVGARPFAVLGMLDEAFVLRGRGTGRDEAHAQALETEAQMRGAEIAMARMVERRVALAARVATWARRG